MCSKIRANKAWDKYKFVTVKEDSQETSSIKSKIGSIEENKEKQNDRNDSTSTTSTDSRTEHLEKYIEVRDVCTNTWRGKSERKVDVS